MYGPYILVELTNVKGKVEVVLMRAADVAIFWDTEPLLGEVWVKMKPRWGEVNAREWDMSL